MADHFMQHNSGQFTKIQNRQENKAIQPMFPSILILNINALGSIPILAQCLREEPGLNLDPFLTLN